MAGADDVQRVLDGVLGIPFTDGNRVEVLRNGVEIFPPMLEAIESAEYRIELLTFVYWQGDIARKFAEALARKASEGATVRVLLDAFGASEMRQDLLDRMKAAGVDVRWFRPKARWKIWEVDNRTHRKVLVVDGRVGFTGGVGIAEEWEGDANNPDEWRDTHFRFTGPAVNGLQGAFYSNWAETGERIFDPVEHMPLAERAGDTRVQIVRATASTGWSDIASLQQLLISMASQRLRIASAYFVPDEDTIDNLCAAVARGVVVEIMMPGAHTDQRVSQLAGEAGFEALLEGGVTLWKYEQTMLHTKVITLDGGVACIGSANFNQRSMRKDDEIAVTVLDRNLVATLDRHFDEDLAHCQRVRAEDWRRRSWWQRALEVVASPFRSQT